MKTPRLEAGVFVSPIVAAELIEEVSSPALAPAGEPIDLDHLSRMTLGERSLEREVLALFDRQADILLERMNSAAPAACGRGVRRSRALLPRNSGSPLPSWLR